MPQLICEIQGVPPDPHCTPMHLLFCPLYFVDLWTPGEVGRWSGWGVGVTWSYFLRSCPSEAELFFWKTWPLLSPPPVDAESSLYSLTELNLRDRVLGEAEKSSYIALPGKGGHSKLMPSKLCPRTSWKCWG